jgi:hypothetical protein
MGMNDQGEVVTASDSPLFVYFEWSLNDEGMFDVFASVVNEDELNEIMADFDAEVEDDETDLTEERSMGGVSKMLYKLVNRMKSEKQSNDVDDYIEHEKQGKTFTQMNEASSKKLGKYLDKLNKLNRKELKARGNKPSLAAGKILNVGVKVPATNEESMPDLKKKMGAKKVTLSNMMKKEETVNEIADTPKGKEAVRRAVHRADATVVDSAINPPRSKKGKREAKNAMKTIDRGIKVHKSKGGVLDNYLKRSYGIKESEEINEISKKKLGDYIKAASHDVATKSAATGRYGDRANRARDEFKKGDYKNYAQGKKDDEFAEKMFKKSWNRRKGIAKAVDKLTKEEKAPFKPTEKPSTPYKNPAAKAKQLARKVMKAQKEKSEKK